jgi:nitroreductase
METEKAIYGRRSVREYEARPVPKEIIDKILKAGAMAPSAMDKQPCRFTVITDNTVIRNLSDKVKSKLGVIGLGARLAEKMKLKEDVIFYGAPLLILVSADKGEWSAIDCSLAAQNMMLAAYDLGLGSCFIGFARTLNNDQKTMEELSIRSSQELFCPLIFGYPKSWPKPKERQAKVQKAI